MQTDNPATPPAPLWGLVLAGGPSRRMGEDKGAIDYHGKPQAVHLLDLSNAHCERCFVSINPAQAGAPVYAALPTIVDETPGRGPAIGLLSAWKAYPQVAWLVAAVDLALLDARTLKVLVEGRRQGVFATVFRHSDGTLEPLLAVWEPRARDGLASRVESGDASPRRYLESVDTAVLDCPDPAILSSANLPAERARILSKQRF